MPQSIAADSTERHVRVLSAVLLFGVVSCQCLEPVDERDGGAAGGSTAGGRAGGSSGGSAGGAGGVAGGSAGGQSGGTAGGQSGGTAGGSPADAGAACTTVSDCPAGPTFPFCGGSTPACVNGFCLYECARPDAGRTCQSTTPECLTCSGTSTCAQCRGFRCTFSAEPIGPACPPPFHDFQNFEVQPFSGRCGAGIVRDGGVHGVWVGHLASGGSLIQIPALGGTCLGSDLATQVPRTVISCPACTFVAQGCE